MADVGYLRRSPVLALSNVSADQTALGQDVPFQCDTKHGLTQLLHEKLFVGVNGSGNHCNKGLNTDTGRNLYVLGQTSEEQQILSSAERFPPVVSFGACVTQREFLSQTLAAKPARIEERCSHITHLACFPFA